MKERPIPYKMAEGPSDTCKAERRLLRAVLRAAMLDYLRHRKRTELQNMDADAEGLEVEAFFWPESYDREAIMSFAWICDGLRADGEGVGLREKILKLLQVKDLTGIVSRTAHATLGRT